MLGRDDNEGGENGHGRDQRKLKSIFIFLTSSFVATSRERDQEQYGVTITTNTL